MTAKKQKESKNRWWVLFKQSDVSEWMMDPDHEDGFETKGQAEVAAKTWLDEQDPEGELLVIYGQSFHYLVHGGALVHLAMSYKMKQQRPVKRGKLITPAQIEDVKLLVRHVGETNAAYEESEEDRTAITGCVWKPDNWKEVHAAASRLRALWKSVKR